VFSYGNTDGKLGELVAAVTNAGKVLTDASGSPAQSWTDPNTKIDIIELNGNINWYFPDSSVARVSGTTEYTNFPIASAVAQEFLGVETISGSQFKALVVLHEMSHLYGAPQETEKTKAAFNANIFHNCLK
jgi:hypothetical protein